MIQDWRKKGKIGLRKFSNAKRAPPKIFLGLKKELWGKNVFGHGGKEAYCMEVIRGKYKHAGQNRVTKRRHNPKNGIDGD